MQDKIIVTYKAALVSKYGPAGSKAIHGALTALVAADKKRGLTSRIVYLDDAAAMKQIGAPVVTNNRNQRETKQAIDALYKKLKPDYLLIVGSNDVVTHQFLTNPALSAGDDNEFAFGDIAYACDEPYGKDPAKFIGPTRVVSRLPDLEGGSEPSHLLALLKTAAQWKSRKIDDYKTYFGLSAAVWQVSTEMSLESIFGQGKTVLAPPKKPPHSPKSLGALMHFINCHGDTGKPEFYGESPGVQPVSLTTKSLKGRIKTGTIASVECCFGAELYNSFMVDEDIPICQTYLRQGAYGYFGSTTISYGPADANGAADLICQYFLRNILGGASTGRAALMARQQFVAKVQQMDAMDLKTLAQFCLFGDPSIHPILEVKSKALPANGNAAKTDRFLRSEIRAKLKETGEFLRKIQADRVAAGAETEHYGQGKKSLARIAAEGGLSGKQAFVAYKVKGAPPPQKGGNGAKKATSAPSRYFLTIGIPQARKGKDNRKVAIVAKEVQGRIVDYRIYHQR